MAALDHGGARPHRRRGASALPYLIAMGLVFLVLAFVDAARGAVEAHLGLERVMLAAIGFLCIHAAWIAYDTARTRERLLDLLAETMAALRGGVPGAPPVVPPVASPVASQSATAARAPAAVSAVADVAAAADPLAPHREAIEILLTALASANVDTRSIARTNLVRLTGQDLGPEPAAWVAWWATRGQRPERPGERT
jgi:hypothetical protein